MECRSKVNEARVSGLLGTSTLLKCATQVMHLVRVRHRPGLKPVWLGRMHWPLSVAVTRGSSLDKGGHQSRLLKVALMILDKYRSCDPSRRELFPRLHACNSTRLIKYLKYGRYLGGAIST